MYASEQYRTIFSVPANIEERCREALELLRSIQRDEEFRALEASPLTRAVEQAVGDIEEGLASADPARNWRDWSW